MEVNQGIVLLSKENAQIIDRLIKEDDDYFPFSKHLFDYFGLDKIRCNEDRALFALLREIDRDNSTNVWRYKKNRNSFYNIIDYIVNPDNRFFDRLREGDNTLPDEIVTECGDGLRSLSSKICKYLCEFAYNRDNYYINDSFIRHILLFYLDYYKVEHPDLSSCRDVNALSYQDLYNWLAKLHRQRDEKYGDTITKNELDHILWYCYKSFDLY